MRVVKKKKLTNKTDNNRLYNFQNTRVILGKT